MSPSQAEQAQRDVIDKGRYSGQSWDKPLKMLRAPQPTMPVEDIARSVQGTVTARIRFDERGLPESVTVISSTSESLSREVVSALSQWRIEPVTQDHKPVKPTITQTFNFKTAP